MARQVVVVVGHGSRVREAVAEFHRFADALAASIGQPILRCFLELADPDLATGLSEAVRAAGTDGEVVILPLFLGAAGHQKNDVASAIQIMRQEFPEVRFRYGAPLGIHANLVQLLDLRVRDALESSDDALTTEETAVLLVGRGSSDPDANSEIARLAHLLFEKRPYLSVERAYQAVARPKIEEGIRRCRLLGARQVIVAPFTLFTGVVKDDICAVADRAAGPLGLRVLHAGHLGVHPLLIEVAAQRMQEAIEGRATVNCDLCKYRFPMAGYEHQAGMPQTTQHFHRGADHDHEHHHGEGEKQ
jgi:sirohydrochlorin cobaltochelatase